MTPQQFNDWRIFPRFLMTLAYGFAGYGWLFVVRWMLGFDWNSIENEVVALALAGSPAIILGVLTTNVGKLTDNYFRTGGTNASNGG